MRDPNRIAPFLEKLKEVWQKYPDLRFGQLAMVIGGYHKDMDTFQIEDDKALIAIENMLTRDY